MEVHALLSSINWHVGETELIKTNYIFGEINDYRCTIHDIHNCFLDWRSELVTVLICVLPLGHC